MRFLPLFADLSSGTVALVGAGAPARAKLRLLQSAGANVRWFVYGIDVSEALSAEDAGRVTIDRTDPLLADFGKFSVVIAATGDARDELIAKCARAANTLVNVVDRPELSNFIMPAIVDRGEVVVAIGTGGASPVLARRLRERIEAVLPARIGELAALMGRYRAAFRATRHASVVAAPLLGARDRWPDRRRGAWPAAGATPSRPGRSHRSDARSRSTRPASCHLVGAGPGDPDLLTLRALQALQNADVVFYDELDRAARFSIARAATPSACSSASGAANPASARTRSTGGWSRRRAPGRNVVRLKGGDPFIFGRGGEELEHLRRRASRRSSFPASPRRWVARPKPACRSPIATKHAADFRHRPSRR